MSGRNLRYILISGLVIAVLVFLAVALGAKSVIENQSRKMVDLKLKSRTADTQLATLAASKKQIEQYTYFNDVAKTVLPSDKNQAQAVADIFQMASDSGIALASLTFPASNLGATAQKTNDAATASPSNVISQASPVEGISGLYSIGLTITPQIGPGTPPAKQVTYAKFLDFLSRIEQNRRTAQITSVNVQPSSASSVKFIITVNIFIKP